MPAQTRSSRVSAHGSIGGIFRLPVLIAAAASLGGGVLPRAAGAALAAGTGPSKPNIVLVMVDDMGFSDLGCFGGEIPTPNLDRLAAEGVRMSQFHNAGRCCPTRAALLTGNYNHFVGMPGMEGPGAKYDPQTGKRVGGKAGGAILRESPSLGEVLRHNGYQTFLAGKWHAGEMSKDQWPLRRGFDRFFGTAKGATPDKFKGTNVIEGEQEIPHPVPAGWYIGNAVGEKAREYVQARDRSRPFFLYYTPLEPHWPWQAPPEDVAPFKGRYDAGYEVLRANRLQNAIAKGVLPPGTQMLPLDPFLPPWGEMKKRPEYATVVAWGEQHAGMVKNIDDNVGRLVSALESEGILDDTIFLFFSDNGGEQMGSYQEQFRWAWPTVLNAPFRWHKVGMHEGGTATPFIVRWPKGAVPANRVNMGQVGHVMDIMPTLLEAIGGEFPKENLGLETIPPSGASLLASWRDPERADPRTLFWEHNGNCAVRDGKWKLVRIYNLDDWNPMKNAKNWDEIQGRERTGKWELYDMDADRGEMDDMAEKMPEKVAELGAKYDEWYKRMEQKPREEFFKDKIEKARVTRQGAAAAP